MDPNIKQSINISTYASLNYNATLRCKLRYLLDNEYYYYAYAFMFAFVYYKTNSIILTILFAIFLSLIRSYAFGCSTSGNLFMRAFETSFIVSTILVKK
jgi:hypothetical protein